MKRFSYLAVSFLVLVLVGCGGHHRNDPPEPQIYGVANIHSDSERPMVAVVRSTETYFTNAAPGTLLPRAKFGWEDVGFGILAPSLADYRYDSDLYSIAAYNDINRDGVYQVTELLGFADCFLRWNASRNKWRIINKDGSVRWSDAYAQSGKGNAFIDCAFSRDGATPAQREQATREAIKSLK